jgi:hypothetical protein
MSDIFNRLERMKLVDLKSSGVIRKVPLFQ